MVLVARQIPFHPIGRRYVLGATTQKKEKMSGRHLLIVLTGDTGAGANAGAGGQSAMTSGAAVAQMVAARDAMQQTADKLQAVSDAIPGMFDEAQRNYLQKIDERAPLIQETYQRTLNGGFQGMFTLVAVCSMIGLILLAFYRDDRPKTIDGKLATPEEQADLGATVVG